MLSLISASWRGAPTLGVIFEMNIDAFHEGQELFYVPERRSGESSAVVVHKVGRKWVHIKWGYQMMCRSRFDPNTGECDGGGFSSPGRVYLSQEIYEREKKANSLWKLLRKAMLNSLHNRPNKLSGESIQHAANILGITLEEEKPQEK
jgi:hypothetical protein